MGTFRLRSACTEEEGSQTSQPCGDGATSLIPTTVAASTLRERRSAKAGGAFFWFPGLRWPATR
jgi:hypothetical protein